MGIRVYYSNGADCIPLEEDFIREFSDEEYRAMQPVFDVLKVRTRIEINSNSNVDLSATTVQSLVEIIYDVLPHQKKEATIASIDQLNEIVQIAREKRRGLSFYSSESQRS